MSRAREFWQDWRHSASFPILLGIRFQKNGQTEVACSLALLKDLIEQVGSRFVDLLVADALYLQTSFIEWVKALQPFVQYTNTY